MHYHISTWQVESMHSSSLDISWNYPVPSEVSGFGSDFVAFKIEISPINYLESDRILLSCHVQVSE